MDPSTAISSNQNKQQIEFLHLKRKIDVYNISGDKA
jgi:hypothetical protein